MAFTAKAGDATQRRWVLEPRAHREHALGSVCGAVHLVRRVTTLTDPTIVAAAVVAAAYDEAVIGYERLPWPQPANLIGELF
jgi:hypothetical protein